MVSIEDGIGGRVFEVEHVLNVHPHMNWPMRLHFQAASASPALVPIPVAWQLFPLTQLLLNHF